MYNNIELSRQKKALLLVSTIDYTIMNIDSGLVGNDIKVIQIAPGHDRALKRNKTVPGRSLSKVAVRVYCAIL